jgi:HK97 family phage portal protein
VSFLDDVERRASLENPSTNLRDPASWFLDAMGVRPTDSGVPISEHTAMRLSTWWGCVRVISETLACLPVILYERLDRGKRHAKDVPLFGLVKDSPNPEMTSFQWRETAQGHVCNWGNHYSEIERDGAGRPIGLWPLPPDRTRAERMLVRDVRTGEVAPRRVVITSVAGSAGFQEKILPAENVLHIPGLGYDGVKGYSVVAMARQSLGLALATEAYGARWFGNGARPSGIIRHPGRLNKAGKDGLRTSLEILHGGIEQAHRIAILDEGMDWKQITVPPEDSQFLQTRQHQGPEICRWHRVPPHMVQDLSKGTFSNIEIQSIEFVRFTMLPWFVRWEQHLNRSLLTPEQRKKYFFEFLVEGLLRGALKERYDAYAVGRQWGWLCADDVRELENMNPLPDGVGQGFLVPMNMIPSDQAANVGQKPEKPAPPSDDEGEGGAIEGDAEEKAYRRREARLLAPAPRRPLLAGPSSGRSSTEATKAQRQLRSSQMRNRQRLAMVPLFRAAGEDVVRQQVAVARKALKKAKRSQRADDSAGLLSTSEFMAEMDRFNARFPETIARAFRPVVETLSTQVDDTIGDELGQEVDDDAGASVEAVIASIAARFIGSAVGQLQALIAANVTEPGTGAIEDAISTRLDEWEATWPDKLADRESVRSVNALSRDAYAGAGVEEMIWVLNSNACPICQEMEGRTVETSGHFADEGDVIEPGDDSDQAPLTVRQVLAHPPLHGGCDCGISAA